MGAETQEELYYSVVQPLVLKTIEGYHSTVLAYGQTGTGKSYTMGLQCDVVSFTYLCLDICNSKFIMLS